MGIGIGTDIHGVDGIVPCGSTGESATMNHAEHQRVITISVEEAAGKVKVIAGTGSNNTAEAVRKARRPVLTVMHPFHKRVFSRPATERTDVPFV